jgi:DNA-binding CsgD family transcriptional regulator
MLIGTLQLRSELRQMVNKVTRNSALQRELMEECLCYLAKLEAASPDHEADWYLQRCGRHLTRFRYLVRSWDGPKLPQLLAERAAVAVNKKMRTSEEIRRFSEVVAALSKHLSKREIKILRALAEGYSLEKVAATLKEEPSTVVRAQRRIAGLILKFGLVTKPERPRKKVRAKAAGGKVEPSRSTPAEVESPVAIMPAISPRNEPPAAQVSPST